MNFYCVTIVSGSFLGRLCCTKVVLTFEFAVEISKCGYSHMNADEQTL